MKYHGECTKPETLGAVIYLSQRVYRCAYLADEFEYVAEGKEYDEDDEERSQHLGRLLMISPLPATHTHNTTHTALVTQTTRQQLTISPLPATHTHAHNTHCTALQTQQPQLTSD